MSWSEFLKDYLSSSRKDRLAILVLLGLIGLAFFMPALIHNKAPSPVPDSRWMDSVINLQNTNAEHPERFSERSTDNYAFEYERSEKSFPKTGLTGELFLFDPNHNSREDWIRLGLRLKTINTIQNYLSKGGRFNKADDLKKIYGLREEEFNRLFPYVRIGSTREVKPTTTDVLPAYPAKQSSSFNHLVDINTADTTALISLPGIGSKLAARIINFRDRLGGFYAIDQVSETYGLPDSTFQMIRKFLKLENADVTKININTATVDQLKSHPYIKWNLAQAIVAYRNEHGPFVTLEELKKIMAIDDEVFLRISPYLTY